MNQESGSTRPRLFFFSSRRRHTRFDCDWSSDVCSSDLAADIPGSKQHRQLCILFPHNRSSPPDSEHWRRDQISLCLARIHFRQLLTTATGETQQISFEAHLRCFCKTFAAIKTIIVAFADSAG